jgi:glycosyltransferase involved in cell wall biosynthesis
VAQKTQGKEQAMNLTVVLPSYNPDEKLLTVVEGVLKEGFTDIVIVNDGSNKEHMAPFHRASLHPEVTVLNHTENRGKGRALKTAFEYCLKNRPDIDGVVTIDGDSQHKPEDILTCSKKMVELGDTVVLGSRSFERKSVPFKSFYGNILTRLVFRVVCGIKVTDTQTGLRAIPAKYLELLTRIKGERYDYETEMLLQFKKKNIKLAEVPIQTIYSDNNSTSHFKAFRDSLMIYRMILRYILGAFASFLIDYTAFSALILVIGANAPRFLRIACAYVPARVLSSLFNYNFNRSVIFKSESPVIKTIRRYYTLWVFQLLVSLGLNYLVGNLLGASPLGEILIKPPVELFLFIISFRIQHHWVFDQ